MTIQLQNDNREYKDVEVQNSPYVFIIYLC